MFGAEMKIRSFSYIKAPSVNDIMEKDLRKQFEEIYDKKWEIPENLIEDYFVLSCLKFSKHRQVYLLEEKTTRQKKILKCGRKNQAQLLREEYELLKKIHSSFFPEAEDFGEENGTFYFLREYIEGKTLYELVNQKEFLSEEESASILLEICKIVQELHTQKPAIIYRDMKPQNLVLKKDGSFCCIDLDSARIYKENEGQDTVCLGTRGVASPEQYGFMQTDERTDIYGLGMLLLYLATGDYQKDGELFYYLSPKMRKIIEKATQFNPSHRYQSIKELQKSLLLFLKESRKASYGNSRKAVFWGIFLGIACLVLGIFLGIELGDRQEESKVKTEDLENGKTIEFHSPLVEEAVRVSLNRPKGDIFEKDLERITSLFICGEKTFTSWDSHLDYHSHYFFEIENPNPISSELLIEDISHFQNLTTLVVDGQNLKEMPDLSEMQLRKLSLCENEIADISSLASQTKLEYLCLEKNPVRELYALENLNQLEFVSVSQTLVSDISSIPGEKLTELHCVDTGIENEKVLENFPNLTILHISNANKEMIQQILKMPTLQGLGLLNSQVTSLEDFSVLPELTGLELNGCGDLTSLEGVEELENITHLGLGNTGITQIPEDFYMGKLEEIEFTNTQIVDYSALSNCKRLRILYMDGDSIERIAAQFSEKSFEIIAVN